MSFGSSGPTPTAQLAEWVERCPDRPFIQCGGEWMTFGALRHRASAVRGGLDALGISAGTRVASILPNREEIVLVSFAALEGRFVHVPLNTYLRGTFLSHQLVDSRATVLFTDRAGYLQLIPVGRDCPALRHVVVVDEDCDPAALTVDRPDVTVHLFRDLAGEIPKSTASLPEPGELAAILYTSGTTGMPKGCMISHGYMGSRLHPWADAGWLKSGDILLSPMPLFHGGAQLCLLMPALQGGLTACFDDGFSVSGFIARAREIGATYTMFPGPMAAAMLRTPADERDTDHRLERCALNPLHPSLQEQFERRFRTRVITRVFGQTEIVPASIGRWRDDPDSRRNSGTAVDGVEIRLVDGEGQAVSPGDVGEIMIRPRRPHSMFDGYWNGTSSLDTDGWHATGDLGRMDGEGQLAFVDRKKESMRRRGENVSAFELERAIAQCPNVKAVAVHPVPSDLGEDEIKACIVEEVQGVLRIENLFGYFRENLPYFAIPRFVEFLPELPTNAMGRVMKQVLRDRGIGEAHDLEALSLSVARRDRRG